jgi:hypothetical protein
MSNPFFFLKCTISFTFICNTYIVQTANNSETQNTSLTYLRDIIISITLIRTLNE